MGLVPHRQEISDDSAMLCWDLGDVMSVGGGSKTVQLTVKEGSIEIDIEYTNGNDEREVGTP